MNIKKYFKYPFWFLRRICLSRNFIVVWGIKTDHGGRKGRNEDSLCVVKPHNEKILIAGVADGMGGLKSRGLNGRKASKKVIENVRKIPQNMNKEPDKTSSELLYMSIQNSQKEIVEQGKGRMGSTISIVIIDGHGKLVWQNVGDSRIYHVSPDNIRQLTRDHSVAWRNFVETGRLSKEEVRVLDENCQLYNYLGLPKEIQIDNGEEQLRAGDCVVICSDGLTDVVDDSIIQDFVNTFPPQKSAKMLVKRAKELAKKEADNISVIVLKALELNKNIVIKHIRSKILSISE